MCELETDEIRHARVALGSFLRRAIAERRTALGFGWTVSAAGPTTFEHVRGAFHTSQMTKRALPVRQLRGGDGGFLFWHDTNHVLLNRDFTPDGEEAVANWQLLQLQMAGYPPTSMEYRVLSADSLGQINCGRVLGRYPQDPARFSARQVLHGHSAAVAIERGE